MARIVVITGAGAGVGRATAVAFARAGYDVALVARGRDRLEAAAREVRAQGANTLVLPLDVADAAAVEAAADRIERELGPIDVWVNVAMVTIFAPVHDISADEFRRVTEVTYLGYVHGTLAALARMRPRDRGTIVQVGSALSYRAIPLQSAYCGAKFAIRGFTDALRSELLHDKSRIRLTMVQLPAVNTPQFDWARNRLPTKVQPVPPIFQPDAIAREIVRAAGRPTREVWLGVSAVKAIIGGMLVPGYADRLLATQGYSGQITSEARPKDQPDNLLEPPPGDPGARGRFTARAQSRCVSFDPAWLRGGALLGLLGALAGAFALGHVVGRERARPRRVPHPQHAPHRAVEQARSFGARPHTVARR
ncbi:SDR family oxidoreductase [Rhodoplanes roseus]|uniref:Short-chain dehydrogenase n=1 Tax=Rhodoplanes roseus TaxID=29409 RepID=A0A327KX16_9BRAD|nr:SDR family oxidoreductase [Rhodoplanes roseus]RAI42851.1 short-chain dehydrogenase [Rhodoplanes roseus]